MLFFHQSRPIKFLDDNDNTLAVIDWRAIRAIEGQGLQQIATLAAAE